MDNRQEGICRIQCDQDTPFCEYLWQVLTSSIVGRCYFQERIEQIDGRRENEIYKFYQDFWRDGIKITWLRRWIKNAFFHCQLWNCLKWRKRCDSCPSYKSCVKKIKRNVSSSFLYFVGKVFDENTGKVSTKVNGWQYFRWKSIWECINYLAQFLTGRCQSYSSVKNSQLAVCTSLEAMCLAFLQSPLKTVNILFLHFVSAWRISFLAMKSSSLIESNHGVDVWLISFRREGVYACLVQCAKSHSTGSPFQLMKTLKHWKFQQ